METAPPPADPRVLVEYVVEANYAGWTLAAYVGEKVPRLLPHHIVKLLSGRALVAPEGIALGPETLVWPGLRFGLRKRAIGDDGEAGPLQVIYQDDALLVVDKPAGLALHPTARYHLSTLIVIEFANMRINEAEDSAGVTWQPIMWARGGNSP